MKTDRNKRFIAGLAVGLALLPISVTAFPQRAHAILGAADFVLDIPNTFQGIIQAVSGVATKASSALTAASTGETAFSSGSLFTKEYILDQLAYILAKEALNSMVDSIVNWANSGFEG